MDPGSVAWTLDKGKCLGPRYWRTFPECLWQWKLCHQTFLEVSGSGGTGGGDGAFFGTLQILCVRQELKGSDSDGKHTRPVASSRTKSYAESVSGWAGVVSAAVPLFPLTLNSLGFLTFTPLGARWGLRYQHSFVD